MEKEIMRTNNMKLEIFNVRFAWVFASVVLLLVLVGVLLLVAGFAQSSFAQDSQPGRFATPGEASNALFQAAQKEDEQTLEAILGAGKEVTSSSDEVNDKLEREQFTKKYQEMHRLVREADGTTVLYIGAENWPFPVPLVSKDGAWYFDSKTGTQEILFRRIGENEAAAIQVCEEFAITKKEHDAKPASYDPITQFAQSLIATDTANPPGKDSSPFHGYNFRIVTANSAGESNNNKNKKMGGPVLLVAYPVEYRSSGVMTFIVRQDGVVYEKDLGSKTPAIASNLTERNSRSKWHAAE
jgi:Protein of unknown function (DUF2950)